MEPLDARGADASILNTTTVFEHIYASPSGYYLKGIQGTKGFIVKENYIGLAVSEILRYKQTDILLLLYKDCKKKRLPECRQQECHPVPDLHWKTLLSSPLPMDKIKISN